MRIAIVNDLRMATEILRRAVLSGSGLEIAWTAADGMEAVERCRADKPDLILMDLIMPHMDGVQATRRIMHASPCPILVVTATVDGNVSLVFDAMSYGALDAVNTPTLNEGGMQGAEELLRKIDHIAHLTGAAPALSTALLSRLPRLLLIGASTGGPAVIAEILQPLPPDLPAAILIAQHVDPAFIGDFVRWLGAHSGRHCQLARAGDRPEPGRVYISDSSAHLFIGQNGELDYLTGPAHGFYQPSANILFESAARCWPRAGAALLLTGMGNDGAAGLLELKQARWLTIAQDEATSVVYGMPRAAIELSAAQEVLPSTAMPARLSSFFGRDGSTETAPPRRS